MTERSSEAIAAALDVQDTGCVNCGHNSTRLEELLIDAAAAIRRLRSQTLINMDRAVEAEDELRRLSARCAALEQAHGEREQLVAHLDLVLSNPENGNSMWCELLRATVIRIRAALSTPSEEPQR